MPLDQGSTQIEQNLLQELAKIVSMETESIFMHLDKDIKENLQKDVNKVVEFITMHQVLYMMENGKKIEKMVLVFILILTDKNIKEIG